MHFCFVFYLEVESEHGAEAPSCFRKRGGGVNPGFEEVSRRFQDFFLSKSRRLRSRRGDGGGGGKTAEAVVAIVVAFAQSTLSCFLLYAS